MNDISTFLKAPDAIVSEKYQRGCSGSIDLTSDFMNYECGQKS